MRSRGNVVGAVVLLAFVGLLVVAALTGDDHEVADDAVGMTAADALVDAYERSRTATYRAAGVFTRTSPDGRSLSAEVEHVQRPPDRLIRQFGSVAGRRDDRGLVCPAPVDGGELECGLTAPGRPFDQVVAAEVAAFRSVVTGPDPLYEVVRVTEDCWRMERTRYDPRSGYGVSARLCFDLEVGAFRRLEVDHGEITEVTEWTERTAEVTDADLEP